MVTCKTFQTVTSVYINTISNIAFYVQLHREAFKIIDSLAFQMHRAIWVLAISQLKYCTVLFGCWQYRNLNIS